LLIAVSVVNKDDEDTACTEELCAMQRRLSRELPTAQNSRMIQGYSFNVVLKV
tara:strand:- start:535 stop:693 length:159 start_codon:yes stop_codon:yes gene_type:complete